MEKHFLYLSDTNWLNLKKKKVGKLNFLISVEKFENKNGLSIIEISIGVMLQIEDNHLKNIFTLNKNLGINLTK